MSSGTHDVAHVTTVHRATDNRILRKECAALREADVDVCLIAAHPRDEVLSGVMVYALPQRTSRLGRMLFGSFDAWKMLRRVKPKMIHVHDPELIPLAAFWRLRRNRVAVYDAHEDLPKQVMGKPYIRPRLQKVVARFAGLLQSLADSALDGIVVATPAIARNYTNSNVVLVQNFPWLRDFPEPVPVGSSGGEKLSYVGAISRERGGLEMIQAALSSAHRPELVLAGPATKEMTKSMAAHEGSGVTYLGTVLADRVPEIIADSRAGLVVLHPLPNHLESQSTKIFEYMAAGRAFIASDFDSWQALLEGHNCGLFVDPLDPEAIRSAIDRILSDPDQAASMGSAGRSAIESTFNFEREAAGLIALVAVLVDA